MVELPTLYCPFPSSVNVHAAQVQQHTTEWASRFALIGPDSCRRFERARYGWLIARTYPNAPFEELAVITDWNVWLFTLDDRCDESALGRQTEPLEAVFSRFMRILQQPGAPADEPLEAGLADIWRRIQTKATASWCTRFARSVEDYFTSCLWEASNRRRGVVPPLAEYIKMRPFTGGLNTDVDLVDIAERIDLPDSVRGHRVVQGLTLMANNVVCWSNDITSFRKERSHGDVHNLVIALQHERSLTPDEAIAAAARMHDAEVQRFIDLAPSLPSFGAAIDDDLARYVGVLRSWMRGHLDWSRESGRYAQASASLEGAA